MKCLAKYVINYKVQLICQKSYQYDVYYNNHSLYCGFDFLLRSVFELCVSNKVKLRINRRLPISFVLNSNNFERN